MRSTLLLLVFLLSALGAAVATSEQDFVVVGDAAIEESLRNSPKLEFPVLLESSSVAISDADIQRELAEDLKSPFMMKEEQLISQNEQQLSQAELLAHQLGAPVLAELEMDRSEHEVNGIERSLLAQEAHHHEETDMELLHQEEHLPTALLEEAPPMPEAQSFLEEGADGDEEEVNFMEVSSSVSRRSRRLKKSNDYAFIDDPKTGGAPTVLKNLHGLDIYVVNTPLPDNSNEIRPVPPPKPMSAALRARARRAEMLRKQLVHDIPQPKAQVKPKTRIDTMSAYEPSLLVSPSLSKEDALARRDLADPLVQGTGARQLKDDRDFRKSRKNFAPRFAQLSSEIEARVGADKLPAFPSDPKAKVPLVAGVGSSFDNRDGPPALLDDMLPIKAVLVEELEPIELNGHGLSKESKPNGW